MLSKQIFKRAFFALLLTGVVNWVSVKLYLYWTIKWIDMVSHFLGGMTVSFAALWLISQDKNFKNWSTKKLFVVSILTTVLVGVLWEIFELTFSITFLSDGIAYWKDTSSDLIMDTVGGFLGFLNIWYLIKNNSEGK